MSLEPSDLKSTENDPLIQSVIIAQEEEQKGVAGDVEKLLHGSRRPETIASENTDDRRHHQTPEKLALTQAERDQENKREEEEEHRRQNKIATRFLWGLGDLLLTPVVGSIGTIIYNCYHLHKLYKESSAYYKELPLFKARVKSLRDGIYIAVASCVPASVLVGLMHSHPLLFSELKNYCHLDNFSRLGVSAGEGHLSEKYNLDDIDALVLTAFAAFFAMVWMIRATGQYFSAKANLKNLPEPERKQEPEQERKRENPELGKFVDHYEKSKEKALSILKTVSSLCPNSTKFQFTFFGLTASLPDNKKSNKNWISPTLPDNKKSNNDWISPTLPNAPPSQFSAYNPSADDDEESIAKAGSGLKP